MAVWRPSGIVAAASGRLAGVEFARHGNLSVLRQAASWKPPDSGLTPQRADLHREVLSVPPDQWPGGALHWQLLASRSLHSNRLGQSRPLKARELWVQWASLYRAVPGLHVPGPPTSSTRAEMPAIAPRGFAAGQQIALECRLPDSIDDGIIWFFGRLRKGPRRGYRRGLVFLAWSVNFPPSKEVGAAVGPQVVNRFGLLQAGNVLELTAVAGHADGRALPSKPRGGSVQL